MKWHALDTMRFNSSTFINKLDYKMKNKARILAVLFLVLTHCFTAAQQTNEKAHRIKKNKFPEPALDYITTNLKDIKHTRFYKEINSSKASYRARFKKDRLWYGIGFNQTGIPKYIEIEIKSIDIPEDAFEAITSYLETNFTSYNIRKLKQIYPVIHENELKKTVKDAFQNLLLPSINYEATIRAKKEKKVQFRKIIFNSEGRYKYML